MIYPSIRSDYLAFDSKRKLFLARIIHDPLRLVDFPPPFSAEANS